MQHDFLDRLNNSIARSELITRITALLTWCREQQIPVIHVRTEINNSGTNRMAHWIKKEYFACVTGTQGAQPPAELKELPGERIIYKPFFNAFHQTALTDILASLQVDKVIIAGLYAHACIRATALHAYEQGYNVWIAEDAIGSTEPTHAELSRHWLHERAATYLSVDAIQHKLRKTTDQENTVQADKCLPVANINNEWQRMSHHHVVPIIHKNPSNTEETLAIVPVADATMTARAATAAHRAWLQWRMNAAHTRIALLQRFQLELQKRQTELEQLLMNEIGKPCLEAREEIQRAFSHINYTLTLQSDELTENRTGNVVQLRHRPAGCYALITPWNNPVAIPVSKIAPALLFGNTVIWKTAPQASCISIVIMEALIAAGLPPGCVNLLFGDATTSRALIQQHQVTAVSLTGSIETGRSVSALCGLLEKPLQAELGGNNACIILADAELESVIDNLAMAAFSFAGQRCTSIRRFIVEASIAKKFTDRLTQAVRALRIGEPQLPDTQIGPMISPQHVHKIQLAVNEAVANHATLLTGGKRPANFTHGCWWEPTLLTNVAENAVIVQQETFGPIAVIQSAMDIADAVRLANNVSQGLLASLLTQDSAAKSYFAEHIEAGILKLVPGPLLVQPGVPFGGWKASRNGPPEHGEWGRAFYTRPQTIYG
jgi:acyl-CoA reductase-like NAD-dependent aldehyde dehydrogenase/nicotinamidase-related amidase